MTVAYGSTAHILSLLTAVAVFFAFYLVLRGKSRKIQKNAVLFIMLFNLAQHILKSFIYPHLIEGGFTLTSTAYNMCAFLIIFSPLSMLLKSDILRDFFLLFGMAAGIAAILVPYWFIGSTPFSWEYLRYMICHVLLFTGSLLPLALGLHKPSFKTIPFLGLMFFGAVFIIILNDITCYCIGIFPTENGENLFEALRNANPVWSFGPPEEFSWLADASKFFSPNSWLGENEAGILIPVLWYSVPLYIIITVLAVPVCMLTNKKGISEYLVSTKIKIRKK